MKLSHLALTIFVVALWGTNFSILKIGLEELPPLWMSALRFSLVAALLAPIFPLPREAHKSVFILSLTLGLLHFGILSLAMKNVDAATGALTIQLQVPFAALIAAVVLRERIEGRTVIGILLAFSGVALIAGRPGFNGDFLSLGLVIVSALGWAVSNLVIKKLSHVNVFALNGYLGLFTAPQLFLLSFLFEDGQFAATMNASTPAWAAVFSTVLVLIVGHGSWYRLIGKYPITLMVPFTLLVPVFGILGGVVLLGEAVSGYSLAGAGAVIAGLAVILVLAKLLRQTFTRFPDQA